MKVLYLVPPGRSVERLTPHSFLDEEIEGLAAQGVEPYVLSESDHAGERRGRIRLEAVPSGRWRERAKLPGLLARHARAIDHDWLSDLRKPFHGMRLELCATELIEREGIALVHSHFGCAFGLGGLVAARETGRPLVASFRGMDLLLEPAMNYGLRRDPAFDRTVRALLRRADMTTYATDFMRAIGIEMGAAEERAVTIRKGVDLDRFHVSEDRKSLRRRLDFARPTVLSVADLIPRKGIDVILHALARIEPRVEFDLVVCGDGPEKGALQELARDVGLSDRVRFTGRISREDVADHFAACDVFVLASHVEAAGNVLLEATSAARPVICTDSGGPPEYVRDGVSGFTVPPGDAVRLASRIECLLADPALAERLGRAGREIAERDHRYDRMISDYLEVYRRALEGSRNGHVEAIPSGAIPIDPLSPGGASPGSPWSRSGRRRIHR